MNKDKELSLLAVPEGVIENHLAPNLSRQDLINLNLAYKKRNFFLKPLQNEKIILFLELVAFGKQKEAEKILKSDRKLLFLTGRVTDYSKRTFEDITAFQYALWALDRHMWNMILKYLPLTEAKKQFHDHVYGKKKYKKLHGLHYKFESLIEALQTYLVTYNNCMSWSSDEMVRRWDEITKHWHEKVGGAQRQVPVHIANEYCRKDQLFNHGSKFDDDNLPRSFFFTTYNKEDGNFHKDNMWFPLSDKGLGIDWSIVRGDEEWKMYPNAFAHRNWSSMGGIRSDLEALANLRDVRTAEFIALKKKLVTTDLTKAQELDSTPPENSLAFTDL